MRQPRTTSRLRSTAGCLAGALLNVALLAGPVLCIAGPRRLGPQVGPFLSLITAWYWFEFACSQRRSQTALPVSRGAWLPAAMGLGLLTVFWVSLLEHALFERALALPKAMTWLTWCGAGSMILGAALRCLAIRQLGQFFLNEVAHLSNQPLITGGIYSRLRHPSEAGTLALALGAALLLSSVSGLVVLCCWLVPCTLYRIRLEDRMLARGCPEQFAGYARAVPALVPRFGWFGENSERR